MNKNIMKALGFGKQIECVENSFCPGCQKPICMSDFKDELSKREFKISGFCQKCQDEIFNVSTPEEEIEEGLPPF